MTRSTLAVAIALSLAACGTETDRDTAPDPLAIVGTYADTFGMTHVVTQDLWTMESSFGIDRFHIVAYANAQKYLIAQNDAANAYNPSLWSRFDWTTHDGKLWFCQTSYDAATQALALAAPAADATDPAVGGCGSFAWSALTATP
jgi:hypothetical protein